MTSPHEKALGELAKTISMKVDPLYEVPPMKITCFTGVPSTCRRRKKKSPQVEIDRIDGIATGVIFLVTDSQKK